VTCINHGVLISCSHDNSIVNLTFHHLNHQCIIQVTCGDGAVVMQHATLLPSGTGRVNITRQWLSCSGSTTMLPGVSLMHSIQALAEQRLQMIWDSQGRQALRIPAFFRVHDKAAINSVTWPTAQVTHRWGILASTCAVAILKPRSDGPRGPIPSIKTTAVIVMVLSTTMMETGGKS
jgi:hypothetical protein